MNWAGYKLQPEDGYMGAETCSSRVLLINYILCNKFVLDCNIIYFYPETNLITGCSFMEIVAVWCDKNAAWEER